MCSESYCEIDKDGDKIYYKNGTKPGEYIFHRTDGPAIEYLMAIKNGISMAKDIEKMDPPLNG